MEDETIDDINKNSVSNTTAESSMKRRDSITDEDLKDMFSVLHKQKQGIQILNDSINSSTRDLMVMERELNL